VADRKQPGKKSGSPRSQAPADATTFQRLSAPVLVALTHVPRWGFVIAIAVVLFAGLAIDGVVGGLLMTLLAVFLGWLAALGWSSYSVPARLLRVAVVAMVAYVAVSKLAGLGTG